MAGTYALCFWPGLVRLWLRGELRGLIVAVAFSVCLNGLLLITFLSPTTWGSRESAYVFGVAAWFTVLCFWCVSVWTTWHNLPQILPAGETRADDALFLQAQSEYLRGDWFLAEKSLRRMLEQSPRDVDCLLMLASLYRHTRRYDEARTRLTELELLSGGTKWLFEIHEERRRLTRAENEKADDAV